MSENKEEATLLWGEIEQEEVADEMSAIKAAWNKPEPEQSSPDVSEPTIFSSLKEEKESIQPKQSIAVDNLKLDVILDVPVTVSLEIGRTQINIRDLLQLNQGSVIELDKLAGEPMDVLVNGTLIAHGEVVVVNDKFGIRLTDVISPSERVKKLG
jgi:flagellar motor switch protein FliN/FliY